jgi:RNA polymerase primary sigma factor
MLYRQSTSSSSHVSKAPDHFAASYPEHESLLPHMSPDEVRVCAKKIQQYTREYRLAVLSNDWVLRAAYELHKAIAEGRASIDRTIEPTRRPDSEIVTRITANLNTVSALIENNKRDVRALFSRKAFETARQMRPGLTREVFSREIWTKLQRRRLHAARLVEEVPLRLTKLKPIFDSYVKVAREMKRDTTQNATSPGDTDYDTNCKKVSKKLLFEFVTRSGMTPATANKNLDQISKSQILRDAEVHKLVLTNRKLIRSIARKYERKYAYTGVTLDDLEQGGAIGLMRAAVLFDYKRGFTFGTYATHWIRNGVQRAAYKLRPFGDSDSRREKRREVRDAKRVLSHRHQREPNAQQIVEYLNEHPGVTRRYSLSEVWEALGRPVISIDQTTNADGKTTLKDNLVKRQADDLVTSGSKQVAEETRAAVLRALEVLNPREREVLLRRCGLHGGSPETLREVGDALSLTRERIRQIEAKALRALRRRLNRDQRKSLLESFEK